jgi:glutamate racemase
LIGVFDSGVGGLSVWRQLAPCLPNVPMIYLGDQAHVPYGARTGDEVRELAERCTRWLIERGCSVIVIACNTASADALHSLRVQFPKTAFVGMEPAVKPAAQHTHTGVIGVLATQVTLRGRLFASVKERFASNVTVLEQVCKEWVEAVEGWKVGRLEGWDNSSNFPTFQLVKRHVEPLLAQNADTLVLGCTHFPFLLPLIERTIDDWRATHPQASEVMVIDPAPAVARQAMRVWGEHEHTQDSASREFWTTGDAQRFDAVASVLLGYVVRSQQVVI